MKTLNHFEASLARILLGLVGEGHLSDVLPLMLREKEIPKCLSRDCVRFVESTLAKGCTRRLAREGYDNTRFLSSGTPKTGRLWERWAPEQLRLSFSKNTMRFLITLTATNAATSRVSGRVNVSKMTVGDHVLNLLAFDAVQDAHLVVENFAARHAFKANALIHLLFPDRINSELRAAEAGENPFDLWLADENIWILEAIQPWLTRRWLTIEEFKYKRESSADALRQVGRKQQGVLCHFLDAIDRAGRRDLGLFLLRTSRSVLRHFRGGAPAEVNGEAQSPPPSRDASHTRWFRNVHFPDNTRLADRVAYYDAGLAMFRALSRLHEWQTEALGIGFYDEGYEQSQFWKSQWETLGGDEIIRRANQLIRSVYPMGMVPTGENEK